MNLALALTPHGVLTLRQTGEEGLPLEPVQGPRLEKAFQRGSGHGLLTLGADQIEVSLPPMLAYWRELGARYVTALCALPAIGEASAKPPVPLPAEDDLAEMAAAAPPMTGAEYLRAGVLADLWRAMDAAFDAELAEAGLSVQAFLRRRHPAWNLVGRVHFNLAENRKDEAAPFAFLATYTKRLSAAAKAQYPRPSRTAWATCGRSSTSSTLAYWDPPSSSRPSSRASPTGRTIPTGPCASWCAPIY